MHNFSMNLKKQILMLGKEEKLNIPYLNSFPVKLPPKDSFYQNVVLNALCNRSQFVEATKWFKSMVNLGCKLDAYTYDIIIHADCNLGRIKEVWKSAFVPDSTQWKESQIGIKS